MDQPAKCHAASKAKTTETQSFYGKKIIQGDNFNMPSRPLQVYVAETLTVSTLLDSTQGLNILLLGWHCFPFHPNLKPHSISLHNTTWWWNPWSKEHHCYHNWFVTIWHHPLGAWHGCSAVWVLLANSGQGEEETLSSFPWPQLWSPEAEK